VLDRLTGGLGRLLLVAVFTLQVIWFAEAWYWASLTMVIGVLTLEWLEWLRKERAAGFQVLTGTAGQDQDADQGERDV
jgi:hypothetical protein